jgi:glycine/D-amino acid oxidase-like deaminating enzyme
VPAETQADEERVLSGHEVATRFQLRTSILDRREIATLIPELRGEWRSGLFTAGDAHGEPGLSTRTIAAAARAAGASIHEDTPVIDVEMRGGRATALVTVRGRCNAATVVLANGIGAPALARRVGLNLPIQLIRSSVGQTAAAKPFTRVAMWGPRVAYRPRADGSFIIGNGYRGAGPDYDITIDSLRNLKRFLHAYRLNWRLLRLSLGGEFLYRLQANLSRQAMARPLPEPAPNVRKIATNLTHFRAMFPHLDGITLERSWAGRIDLTPDVIPIIDRPDPNANHFVAAGFSGHGFALGPAIGKQLSEWILDGRPSIDLRPFRLARFQEDYVQRAQQAL